MFFSEFLCLKSLQNVRICLIKETVDCAQTLEAAKGLSVPILISNTGLEYMNDPEWKTFYVMKEFQGEIFDTLTKNKERYI